MNDDDDRTLMLNTLSHTDSGNRTFTWVFFFAAKRTSRG